MKAIDQDIRAISFQELRKPSMATNDKLLTLREVLTDLATATSDTSKYVLAMYGNYISALQQPFELERLPHCHSPVKKLASIKQQASGLERFLMDSFQLLMSTISVVETQTGAEQTIISMQRAGRTSRLTQLAFIYVPLTFITSIFDMDVKRPSDPLPPIWVCFITLLVAAAATAAIFGGYAVINLLRKRDDQATLARRNTVYSHAEHDGMVVDVEKQSGNAQATVRD